MTLCGYAASAARTVGPVPKEWGLDPFYTKAIQADITRITASDAVCDEALINMANVIETLLSKIKTNHPAIHNMLKEKKHRFAIIGKEQNTLELPEYRHLSKKGFGWTRGLGGTVWGALSSCGEENALHLGKPEDRYGDEYFSICTQCWFSVMIPSPDGKPNGIKNHVHSRETLKEYDPDMAAIMESLYTTDSLPPPWNRTFK